MKLKSILMLSMVAILAMVGGAMAATTTTTTDSTDLDGTFFGRDINLGPMVTCDFTTVDTVNTCSIVNDGSFATDWGSGSGYGLGAGSAPAQVAYDDNGVIGTEDYIGNAANSLSGYELDQTLFGMCGNSGCSANVPTPGLATLADSQGAGSIPVGTDEFNQANFTTQLVSGFLEGATDFGNKLSQQMDHNGGLSLDGDYIDQRLAMFEFADNANAAAGYQELLQSAEIGAGNALVIEFGAEDPEYIDIGTNSGVIAQAMGDNQAGKGAGGITDIGSYGQLFNNTTQMTNGMIAPNPPSVPLDDYTMPVAVP